MAINYQIMTEEQKNEKGYVPNYDELIKNATCKEEAEAWEDARKIFEKVGVAFAFNTVYATKQSCGHWEVFQMHCNEHRTIEEILQFAEEDARERKCTRCICGR